MKPEVVAFLDTNYCLHYPLPNQTDWGKLLGAKAVRLVACLGLLDELDSKKDHPTLGDRAKRWIKLLHASRHAPSVIRDNVTLELFKSAAAVKSMSRSKGDAAIAAQAKQFEELNESIELVMVTEDIGMAARCDFLGLVVGEPDNKTRLADPVSELQKKNNEQARELLAIKNARPEVRLAVAGGSKESDGRGPLFFTLTKPAPDSFSKQIPEFVERNGISNTGHPQMRQNYENAVETMQKWADANQLVEEESSRTIQLSLALKNVGRSPAKGLEVTVTFPAVISATSMGNIFAGPRSPVHTCPRLAQRRQVYDPQRGYIYVEPGFLEDAKSVPPTLHLKDKGLGYLGTTDHLDTSRFIWREAELGHGKTATSHPLYLTFSSWDNVGPAELEVHIYGSDPPIDDRYTMKIIPTLEET